MTISRRRVLAAAIAAPLAAAAFALPASAGQPYNILFYGNSFTQGSGGVQLIVRDIAVAAGQPAPYVRSAAIGGTSFADHLAFNTNVITSGIPVGQQWDFVVLQDFSTSPTRLGDTAAHRANALALFNQVRNHSPNVNAVMFETWARGPGHSFYTGANPTYPGGPSEMQAELREGYALSTADLRAAHGPDRAEPAWVGTAWESTNWNNLHASDLWHANNRGSLLAGLVLFSAIYDMPTSDLDLTPLLTRLGLTAADGAELTAAADAVIPTPATPALLAAGALAWFRRRR